MARRRFFVETVRNGQAELTGDHAEHLRRVLRAERGQRFEISDNERVYLAEIEAFCKGQVQFRVLEEVAAETPAARFTLLVSLIKFDRFEWIVEKATELGAEVIVPVKAERSEKGLDVAAAKRLDRWRRIALESSQQSRRTRIPQVMEPLSFALALSVKSDYRFLLDEDIGAGAILEAAPAQRSAADRVSLLVGPEGGWTESERKEAAEKQWRAVSLGPQILRAETAAIAALAVLAAAWCTSSAAK
jgi:16S rRNA (uracil1498-N3)-methyltransferase